MSKKRILQPGGVDEYISACPKAVQHHLKEIRKAIRSVAPKAIETVSYFDMPGYSYEGYDYHGMFVWFSFKAPFVRLHVRPQALVLHKKDVEEYVRTKAVMNFPIEKAVPKTLVKKLVRASLKAMKDAAK